MRFSELFEDDEGWLHEEMLPELLWDAFEKHHETEVRARVNDVQSAWTSAKANDLAHKFTQTFHRAFVFLVKTPLEFPSWIDDDRLKELVSLCDAHGLKEIYADLFEHINNRFF